LTMDATVRPVVADVRDPTIGTGIEAGVVA